MSSSLTNVFRAQLTTTMDSVLKRTVFKIMNIFENTFHDHQMELTQKEDEIAQLKLKLQRLEVKLTESGHEREEESTTQMNGSQGEVENASGQTSDIAEIDFEVPDDWCAPLGCETAIDKEDDMCPSVRLRQLYIPLWHIPLIKKEVDNSDIDSHTQKKGSRRSKRISSSKRSKKCISQSTQTNIHASLRQPVRDDMKILLQENKPEFTDVTGKCKVLRRGKTNSPGKEQMDILKNTKMPSTECNQKKAVENGAGKIYSCKKCLKEFDTAFGLSVHTRFHTRCRGCKKGFPSKSALEAHKRDCVKHKKLLLKKRLSTDPPKRRRHNKAKPPPSSSLSELSIRVEESTKNNSCAFCNKTFNAPYKLKEHLRLHTGEKPYLCSMCPLKFRIRYSLKKHFLRRHMGQSGGGLKTKDRASTTPLEVIKDQEGATFRSTDTSQKINHNKLQRDPKADKNLASRWKTLGKRHENGYICLLCGTFLKNKYFFVKHLDTHKNNVTQI